MPVCDPVDDVLRDPQQRVLALEHPLSIPEPVDVCAVHEQLGAPVFLCTHAGQEAASKVQSTAQLTKEPR